MKYRFKIPPFEHQYNAVIRALKQGFIGLLWEPGIGKTKVIVDWACALRTMGALDRVLIVCPVSVMGVWTEEWEKNAPVAYWLTMMEETRTKIPSVHGALHVVVINYDKVWRENVKEALKKFDPQMVVADESHRIKKASANRSWAMRAWRYADYRSILTGTPTPKSLLDLYSQWVFLNCKRFGTRIESYVARYIIFGGYMKKQVKGYRRENLPELFRKVKKDATVKRADQCLDLPPITFQRIPVALEPRALEMYDRLARELFLELQSGKVVDAKNAAVKLLRLQQLVGGFLGGVEDGELDGTTIERVSTAKLRALYDILQDRKETGERLVVFCRFRPEIEAIRKLCVRLKLTHYVLHGDIRRQDRDELRRKFQTRRGPSVFIAQIQTGSLGINLHSAREAIFFSTTYSLEDYVQGFKRLHRQGQKRKVIIRHLVAVGTVDEDIYKALADKEDVLKMIMGKPKILLRQRSRFDTISSAV